MTQSSQQNQPRVKHSVYAAKVTSEINALQAECVAWSEQNLDQYPLLEMLIHPESGIGRTQAETIKLSEIGAKKGAPRLIVLAPSITRRHRYSGLAVEIKLAGDSVSSEQREWMQKLKAHGYLHVVISSLNEFIDAVKKFHFECPQDEHPQ